MNILSLFDGISCGQIAIQRAGLHYSNYFASEIEPESIQITQHHFPNTVQLGSVVDYDKWELPKIDLLIGGSPCQDLSPAGHERGLEGERSGLFFKYIECLHKFKPKYFLLENVPMKKEFENQMSDIIGCKPIKINSALLSAQQRRRLYWTNIPNISQPQNRHIYLKDILEPNITDIIPRHRYQDQPLESLFRQNKKPLEYCKKIGYIDRDKGTTRFYSIYGKSRALITGGGGLDLGGGLYLVDEQTIRRLNFLERERLQTLPENYTNVTGIGVQKRRKAIGNGWTVDIIAHIFSHIQDI